MAAESLLDNKIIVVGREHIPAFKRLRLRGLHEHPEAFGETVEAFTARSDEQIADRIQAQSELGGFILAAISVSGEMLGVVGLALNGEDKVRHRGNLWGMYVIPECRGQGVASMLIQELLRRARQVQGLEQIHLAVVTSNDSALVLYKKMGFSTYGTDPRVLKIGSTAYDEYLMWMDLRLIPT